MKYIFHRDYEINLPCAVCNAWLKVSEWLKQNQESTQLRVCDACRKAIKRENEM